MQFVRVCESERDNCIQEELQLGWLLDVIHIHIQEELQVGRASHVNRERFNEEEACVGWVFEPDPGMCTQKNIGELRLGWLPQSVVNRNYESLNVWNIQYQALK